MTKLVRHLILFAAAFILLLIGIHFFVKNKIENAIDSEMSNLGDTGYEQLEVSVWSGRIHLQQVHFDTELGNVAPSFSNKRVEGKANSIYLDGLSWWNLWRNNKLIASEIGMEGGVVDIYGIKSDTLEEKAKDVDQSKDFKAEIRSIVFENGKIQLFENEEDTLSDIAIGEMLISVESFEFDGENYTIDKVKADVEEIALRTEGNLEELRIQKLYTDEDQLFLEDLAFTSKGKKEHFDQLVKWRKSWVDIRVPMIEFHALNWQELFKGSFSSGLVKLKQPIILAYSDQNIPKKMDDYKQLPMQVFTQADFTVAIDSIYVEEASVTYELLAKDHPDAGKIFWKNVEATARNLTNDSLHIAKDDQFAISVKSQFMDVTPFDLDVNFDLNDPNFAYHFKGNLGKIDLATVNRMFEYALHIRAESGTIEQLAFNVYANDDKAKGDMIFYYRDLNMQLLDDEYNRSKKIIERLAELILIKQNNLADGKDKRGEIEIEREKNKAIFGQLWDAIADGLRSVILP